MLCNSVLAIAASLFIIFFISIAVYTQLPWDRKFYMRERLKQIFSIKHK